MKTPENSQAPPQGVAEAFGKTGWSLKGRKGLGCLVSVLSILSILRWAARCGRKSSRGEQRVSQASEVAARSPWGTPRR